MTPGVALTFTSFSFFLFLKLHQAYISMHDLLPEIIIQFFSIVKPNKNNNTMITINMFILIYIDKIIERNPKFFQ